MNLSLYNALSAFADPTYFNNWVNTKSSKSDDFFVNPKTGDYLDCVYTPYGDQASDWYLARNYYPVYYELFDIVFSVLNREIRAAEIGVKTGYIGVVGAISAMWNNKKLHYTGIDINEYISNGLSIADSAFSQLEYPGFTWNLILGDSTTDETKNTLIESQKYDIIHIDGAHDYNSKISDLYLAKECISADGIILVDDYGYCQDIIPAVDEFVKHTRMRLIRVDTLRGMAILL